MKKTASTFPNIRKDWDTYRLDVMYYCIKVKITEHKNLADILLSTVIYYLLNIQKMIFFVEWR